MDSPKNERPVWKPLKWRTRHHQTAPMPLPAHETTERATTLSDSSEIATGDKVLTLSTETTLDTAAVERRRDTVTTIARVNGVLTPLVLCGFALLTVRHVDPGQADSLGLFDVMPFTYYGIIGLLSASFMLRLRRRNIDVLAMSAHVLVLIFLLHGIVSVIEGFPRFPAAYTHQGLTEYIQRTNNTLPMLDARMNWPAFFLASAVLRNIADLPDLIPILLWAPLVYNLMYAPAIYSLARALSRDVRTPWLTLWLYFSVSWVGQDYYSPQASAFLLFLVFMTLLIRYFRSDHAEFPAFIQRITNRFTPFLLRIANNHELLPGPAPVVPTTSGQRAALVMALVALYAASVMSHQLTPVFMLLEVTALVILRRTALRGFHTLMIVLFFGYISFGAIGFWSGHLQDMFGGIGSLGSTINENVGARVERSTLHNYVIKGRLLFAAVIWLIAVIGLYRRVRAGRSDLVALVGLAAPFLVLGGQSYGGEAGLRVFLFSLPFAAVLCTFALLPLASTRFSPWKVSVAILAAILIIPAFFITRFGNEQFEYITKNEYRGIVKMYALIPEDATLIGVSGNNPWKIKNLESHDYVDINRDTTEKRFDAERIQEVTRENLKREPYVVISRSMLQYVAMETGRDRNWGNSLITQLIATNQYTVVYQNADFTLLRPLGASRKEMKDTP